MIRINVPLKTKEKDALWVLSERERRDPRAQAAVIIRQALEQLGLLMPVELSIKLNGGVTDETP